MVFAYFHYYHRHFPDLSGFDIGSHLLCFRIQIDVCPLDGHFCSYEWGSRGCLSVELTLPMVGMATLATLCARGRVGHRSWRKIFCKFHWSTQHLWKWILMLGRPWSPACSPCHGDILPWQSHDFQDYLAACHIPNQLAIPFPMSGQQNT